MSSQRDSASDEEYLDDPIKLFESEQERVHFGSQSQGTFYQSNENHKVGDELFKTLSNDLENSQKYNCLPSCVKLIDCAKFPWYYKKYTQQIIAKIDICDLANDSDSDISVEFIEDSTNDCFIVNETTKGPDKMNSKSCITVPRPIVIYKTSEEKRQEIMKRKEDIEIQKALSQRNTGLIDFKRNKGLIGMTITQKFIKDIRSKTVTCQQNKTKIPEARDQNSLLYKTSISVADQALRSNETALKAISDETKSINKDKNYTSEELATGVPVKFSLGQIPKNILQRITTKKSQNRCPKTKEQGNKLQTVCKKQKSDRNLSKSHKVSRSPNKVEISSHCIKDIRKPNDEEIKRTKAIANMFLDLLTSEPNKKDIIYDTKKEDADLNVNQSKRFDEECEQNSPILPCSMAKKKGNLNESIRVLDNSFIDGKREISRTQNVIHKPDIVSQVKDKIAEENINITENKEKVSPQVTTIQDIKQLPPKVMVNNQLNKTEISIGTPISSNVAVKSIESLTNIQSYSSNHTNVTPTIPRYVSLTHNNCNNLFAITNTTSNYTPYCITSQTNMISQGPNERTNLVTCITSGNSAAKTNHWPNVSTAIHNNITPSGGNVAMAQSKLMTVANSDSNISSVNSPKTNMPPQITPSYKVDHNSFKNNNSSPYNHCTSAIVLRPNNFVSVTRYSQPGLNVQESQKNPVQMQPRFYDNPYKPNYYTSLHHTDQRFLPRLANCTNTNYRFPTPHESSCKSLHNPQPALANYSNTNYRFPRPNGNVSKSLNNPPPAHPGWHLSNCFPKFVPRSQNPRNVIPCSLPIQTPLQTPRLISYSKPGVASQPHFYINQNYSPQSPNNHEDLSKRLDPRLSQGNKDLGILTNSDLVTSKTKMLELLDSATTDLKRCINEDDNIVKSVVEACKRSKISHTFNDIIHQKQLDQHKGYSPPILPIPTFEKVLGTKVDTQQQRNPNVNTISQMNINKGSKCISTKARKNKKPVAEISQECAKKGDVKKISLEEYKKRTLTDDQAEDYIKIKHKKKNDTNKKQSNVQNPKCKVDRFSTESDLGYDSDSTVII